MEYKQIYEAVNAATKVALGKEDIVTADMSNIVDVGKAVFDANSLDKFVGALVDHIGKVIFVNRSYKMRAPSVLMDGWEYGQVLEKVSTNDLPDASVNEAWELQDGQDYPVTTFSASKVQAKFYSKRTTFNVKKSLPTYQMQGAFSSRDQMSGFVAMLWTYLENSIELKNERLIMYTLANSIADAYHKDVGASDASTVSGTHAVNLLKEYNDEKGGQLTAAQALLDTNFMKYAAYRISHVSDNMTTYSTLFNVSGTPRFTPKDRQKIVLLSDFYDRCNTFLQSTVFHDEYTKLPAAEYVPYWQGSGTGFKLADTGKIDIKTVSGNSVKIACVLGCIFDRDNLGVANMNRRTASQYIASADFYNYWLKVDAGYFVDDDENMVVFYLA